MIKQIDYMGKKIDVEEVDIITAHESWNEYQLTNGDVLKFKSLVTVVYKAVSEKSPDGEPLYMVQSQNYVRRKGL